MATNQPAGLVTILARLLLTGLAAAHGLLAAPPALAANPIQLDAAGETDNANAADARQLDDLDSYRLALLKMKAHLGIARDLLRQRVGSAGEYMHEPLKAILQAHSKAFRQWGALVDDSILAGLAGAADTESVPAKINALETAQTAVEGSIARTGRMARTSSLKLARALYHAAVADYGQAVSGNSVVDAFGYRSGRGFVTVAESLLRRSGVFAGDGPLKELRQAALLLREAWPGATLPEIASAPSDVAQWLTRLDTAINSAIKQQND